MITRHLRRVDPTLRGTALRRAVQEAFDSYARYWLESFRLPYLSARAVDRGMRDRRLRRHITDGLAKGNGVILALPHLGGWEWAGRWLADLGHGLTVVVERLDPPELFDWFADLRSKLGMKVVAARPERRSRGDRRPARATTSCACCATATSSATASRSSSSASAPRCRPAR